MPAPPALGQEPAAARETDPHHALPRAGEGASTVNDPGHMLPAEASEPPVRRRPWRLIAVITLILLVIAFAVWRIHTNTSETASTNNRAAMFANRPTPVLTSVVQQRTVPIYLTALGTVTAYNTVTLHSRVDGQLLQVNFHEGQAVRQGQLLLQIDPRPYQASLAQAQGQLTKDQATARNAEAEAQRYTALYQAGVVSKESQQTQLASAGQSAGSIAADQAAIQAAKVNLSYTSIYSPINGIVGLRQVDPGNIVHASDSTGLVVITQVHPIAVIFTLPEDQLPQVQSAMRGGHKLSVEAYDRTDAHRIATGSLLTIDNQIDTTTGTAKLKAVFDNTDDALFPNQFVNVRLILQQRQNAIVVPSAAIESGNNGSFLFVVRPGPTPANKRPHNGANASSGNPRAGNPPRAEARAPQGAGDNAQPRGPQFHVDAMPVHVDLQQGANSILADDTLKPGDQVVIDGQEKLIDGAAVQPQPGSPPSTPSSGSGSNTAIGAANPNNPQQPPSGNQQPTGDQNPATPRHQRDNGQNPDSAGGSHP